MIIGRVAVEECIAPSVPILCCTVYRIDRVQWVRQRDLEWAEMKRVSRFLRIRQNDPQTPARRCAKAASRQDLLKFQVVPWRSPSPLGQATNQ